MKDVEERQKEYKLRKIQVIFLKIGLVTGLIVFFFFILILMSALQSGYKIDPTEVVTLNYHGFDGYAKAELKVDREALVAELRKAYAKYESSIWPLKKRYTKEDFENFAMSFTGSLDISENLSNDDQVVIKFEYDQELARAIKIRIKYSDITMTVSDLSTGAAITKEDFFKDIEINLRGYSPLIMVDITNHSQNEFLQSIEYVVLDAKDMYEKDDIIKIKAVYDEEDLYKANYYLKGDVPEIEYTITGDRTYIRSTDEFTKDIFNMAVKQGESCFVGANEYGLRIFTEAGLQYTWEGTQDYTFEWSNPRLISAYIETLKDDKKCAEGKKYNYLELVYQIYISQADGTGCDAEAVVCFEDITVDEDGNIDINPDSGQLFSASYLDKNIKSSLQGWFGDDYNLERFDLTRFQDEDIQE